MINNSENLHLSDEELSKVGNNIIFCFYLIFLTANQIIYSIFLFIRKLLLPKREHSYYLSKKYSKWVFNNTSRRKQNEYLAIIAFKSSIILNNKTEIFERFRTEQDDKIDTFLQNKYSKFFDFELNRIYENNNLWYIDYGRHKKIPIKFDKGIKIVNFMLKKYNETGKTKFPVVEVWTEIFGQNLKGDEELSGDKCKRNINNNIKTLIDHLSSICDQLGISDELPKYINRIHAHVDNSKSDLMYDEERYIVEYKLPDEEDKIIF